MKPKAPVLNQAAIKGLKTSGPRSPEEREDAERERNRRERVAYAVEFGSALEDLVAYTHKVAHDQIRQSESGPAPRTEGPRFVPDLFVNIAPKVSFRRARQTLLKLEPRLLKEPEE